MPALLPAECVVPGPLISAATGAANPWTSSHDADPGAAPTLAPLPAWSPQTDPPGQLHPASAAPRGAPTERPQPGLPTACVSPPHHDTGHQQLPACRHRTETGWEKLQAMSLNKHPGAADSPAVSKQHLVADVSVTWLVKYSLMSAQICITCGTDSRTRGVIGTVKLHCAGHCRCQTCCALPVKHTKTKA